MLIQNILNLEMAESNKDAVDEVEMLEDIEESKMELDEIRKEPLNFVKIARCRKLQKNEIWTLRSHGRRKMKT